MRQYHEAKRQYRDAIVFFRMGDFYEMFFEDALVAVARARADAHVAIEGRERRRDPDVRRAVPCRRRLPRAARQKGYRVAICEQVEDPRKAKGVVRREVVRVVSPGTLLDCELPGRARARLPDEPRPRSRRRGRPRGTCSRRTHRVRRISAPRPDDVAAIGAEAHQESRLARVQLFRFEQRSGRHDAHDLAPDDALGLVGSSTCSQMATRKPLRTSRAR